MTTDPQRFLCARSPPLSLHRALLISLDFETADGGKYLGELAGTGGEGREGLESSLKLQSWDLVVVTGSPESSHNAPVPPFSHTHFWKKAAFLSAVCQASCRQCFH